MEKIELKPYCKNLWGILLDETQEETEIAIDEEDF